MEILILIAIPAVLTWILVFFDRQDRTRANLLPTLGLMVLISGCVFGHEFFHISAGPIPITLDRILMGGMLAIFVWLFLMGKEDIRKLNRVDVAVLRGYFHLAFFVSTCRNRRGRCVRGGWSTNTRRHHRRRPCR